MATYPWPTTDPFLASQVEFRSRPNVRVSESLYTNQAITYELPFSSWEAVVTIPSDTALQRAQVEAFITKIGGPANRVTLWHLARPTPRGTQQTNTTTTGTAAQGASTVNVNLSGGTLLAGDMIGIAMTAGGMALVMVTADATSGGSVAVSFAPKLRGAVSNGAVVTVIRPAPPFILAEPPRIGYYGANQATPITLTFVEDTNP